MHGNNTLGRFKHFGRGVTYNPFANNSDLKQVSNEHFYISNQNTFSGNPVVVVSTGLVPTALSFLNTDDFNAEILDIDGTLLRSLNAKLGSIGSNNYPQVDEIIWFDTEGCQGDFWINDNWKGKILKINGKFEATAITASEMNQLTGCIMGFGGDIASIPNRALVCQGQAVSRYYYSNLFNVIGTKFGEGDGSTTFNLPDFRNGVMKGADQEKEAGATDISVLLDPDKNTRFAGKSGGASGNKVGSYQRYAVQNHKHPHTHGNDPHNHLLPRTGEHQWAGGWASERGNSGNNWSDVSIINIHWSDAWGTDLANSTRDNNIAVNFIIFI